MRWYLPLLLAGLAGGLCGQVPDAREISAGEYFWDIDPGQGNGTPFTAGDGALDETIEALLGSAISTAVLGAGPHTFKVRVKDPDNNWSPLFTTVVQVVSSGIGPPPRSVVHAEYFWDGDPGQGNGTPLTATDGALDEAIESLLANAVPTAALGPGPHAFHIRVKDPDNNWSPLFTTVVEVEESGSGPPPRNVVQAEYFWDTDPGQGNGSILLALDGALDETIEAVLGSGIAAPGAFGPHTFNVRVKDPYNNWSPLFTTVVEVEESGSGPPPRSVVQAEYFWDTDPGQGSGTTLLALDGALDETIEAVLGSGLTAPGGLGPHTFNVRVKDPYNNWSPLFTTVVEVEDSGSGAPARSVVQAEYFWDVDPGLGSGTALLALDGALNETIEAVLGTGIGPPGGSGSHTFNLRLKDPNNNWSPLFTTVVHVEENGSGAPQRNLVQAEYFWDVDPGLGGGTALLALDGALNETIESVLGSGINHPVGSGPHTFNVRVREANNNWSPLFTTVVHVDDSGSGAPPRNLVQAEYFWDIDPGPGNGTALLALDGALNETVESVLRSGIASSEAYGPHTFNVRVRDANGSWSPAFTTVVHHTIDDGSGMPDLTGDPDQDGLDNLLEYFLGTSPFVADLRSDHFITGFEINPGLGPEPRLFYQILRNHIASDVEIETQITTNLVEWFTEPNGALITLTDTESQLKFLATQPVVITGGQYFRLRLQWNPAP